MALTAQQEQQRLAYNAANPGMELTAAQFEQYASGGRTPGVSQALMTPYAANSTQSMTQRREDAIIQSYNVDPREIDAEMRAEILRSHAQVQAMSSQPTGGGTYANPSNQALIQQQHAAVISIMTPQERAYYQSTGQMPPTVMQRYSQLTGNQQQNPHMGSPGNPGSFASMQELEAYLRARDGGQSPGHPASSAPSGGGSGRPSGYAQPTVSPLSGGLNTQAAMMAGNTYAQHNNIITPITPSVYSSMGAGIPNRAPGELDRMHLNQDAYHRTRLPGETQAEWQDRMTRESGMVGNPFLATHGPQSQAGARVGAFRDVATSEGETTRTASDYEMFQLHVAELDRRLARGDITQQEHRYYMQQLADQADAQRQAEMQAAESGDGSQSAYEAALQAANAFEDTPSTGSGSTTGGSPSGTATTPTNPAELSYAQIAAMTPEERDAVFNTRSRGGATPTTTQAGGTGADTGSGTGTTAPTAAGPTGPTTGDLLSQLIGTYQNAYDEAMAHERARFEHGQEAFRDRTNAIMGQFGTLGEAQLADINRRYDQMQGSAAQNAISRGLYNSTVLDSLQRGVEDDRSRSLAQANDALTRERLGYLERLTGDELGFFERPSMAYPDLSSLAGLAQGIGSAGQGVTVNVPGGGGTPQTPAQGQQPPQTTQQPAQPTGTQQPQPQGQQPAPQQQQSAHLGGATQPTGTTAPTFPDFSFQQGQPQPETAQPPQQQEQHGALPSNFQGRAVAGSAVAPQEAGQAMPKPPTAAGMTYANMAEQQRTATNPLAATPPQKLKQNAARPAVSGFLRARGMYGNA